MLFELRGKASLINCKKTATASKIVIVRDILSPLSGGRKNPNKTVITNTRHGAMTLNTKYNGFRSNIIWNVISTYGFGQHVYLTTFRVLRTASTSHSLDGAYCSVRRGRESFSRLIPAISNVHEPNFKWQSCLSKGKYLKWKGEI